MPVLKIDHTGLAALQWVFDNNIITNWTVAIDGGAFAGEWTRELAKKFGHVHAFESTPETFKELSRRVRRRNVTLHHAALFDHATKVESIQPAKRDTLTARLVVESEAGDIDAVTIDSLGLKSCGLIKLDLEGAELAALKGARRTLIRRRPVLIVEITKRCKAFGNTVDDTLTYIGNKRYRLVHEVGVDKVFVPL